MMTARDADEEEGLLVELEPSGDDVKSVDEKNGPSSSTSTSSTPAKSFAEELSKIPITRLLALAKSEWLFITIGTVALLISAGGQLVVPGVIGKVIDAILKGGSLSAPVIYLFVFLIVSSIFAYVRTALYTIAGERIVARLRDQLFQSLVSQEIAFFDITRTGEIVNRLSSDCTLVQGTVTENVALGLRWLVTFVGGVIIMFITSWKLSMMVLLVIPIVGVAVVFYGRVIKNLSKEVQDALADSTTVAEEILSNIRTVRMFSAEEFAMNDYHKQVFRSFDLAKRRAHIVGTFIGLAQLIASLIIVAGLWYGGKLTRDGELTAGVLTSFLIYTIGVGAAFGGLTNMYGDLMKAAGASERIFGLIDRVPTIRFRGGKRLDEVQGVIELQNIRFSYPSRPNVEVIRDLSLKLEPGKVIALVGPSGQGKSTIASLIQGLYEPQRGTVSLDGNDIKTINPKYLRSVMSSVSQEPSLFATTIADNIVYGIDDELYFKTPAEKRQKIEEAAKMANAHEFIVQFPEGMIIFQYDTVVGERGVRLSGGQKQRVAIARALVRDPRILILDEATSALDSESEHLVKQAIDALLKHLNGRTVLIIAHRLSTVKNADKVCVISEGHIAESGTHDELLALNGIYKQLVSRQLSAE